jgi:hypothetical protein
MDIEIENILLPPESEIESDEFKELPKLTREEEINLELRKHTQEIMLKGLPMTRWD